MYNYEEEQYLNLVLDAMAHGSESDDRTGVGTRSLFAPRTMHFSLLDDTLPLMTSRRTFFRGAVEELLWMLRGSTDAKELQAKDIHIWDGNTTEQFIFDRDLHDILPKGNIGALYGFQLRNWNGDLEHYLATGERTGIDQLENVIELLKADPTSRRAVISFYNVGQLYQGVLEPCHLMYIFYVDQKTNKLFCHLTIRSWDLMCGAPINIVWTALFTKIIAKAVGLDVGGIATTGVNCHVYKNHFEQAKIQVARTPYHFPKVFIDKPINNLQDIENLKYEYFRLEGYKYHEPIKYDMAV